MYLEVHSHKSKQPNKTPRSTYRNIHINTYILTSSKLSSTYTDAVISRDLLQAVFCCMYLRIQFNFSVAGTEQVFSPLFHYVFQ